MKRREHLELQGASMIFAGVLLGLIVRDMQFIGGIMFMFGLMLWKDAERRKR